MWKMCPIRLSFASTAAAAASVISSEEGTDKIKGNVM